jgi:hypothetical protein
MLAIMTTGHPHLWGEPQALSPRLLTTFYKLQNPQLLRLEQGGDAVVGV